MTLFLNGPEAQRTIGMSLVLQVFGHKCPIIGQLRDHQSDYISS